MQVAKEKVVAVDYTLKNDKGELLDTSDGQEPLSYLHGFGQFIPGLETSLEGKTVGDEFDVVVSAADGYGERNDEMVFVVAKENFDEIEELQVGMQLFMSIEDEQDEEIAHDTVVTVIEIVDDTVTVDGNHELAGMELHFNVAVRDVRDATPEEIEHEHVHGEGCDHDH